MEERREMNFKIKQDMLCGFTTWNHVKKALCTEGF